MSASEANTLFEGAERLAGSASAPGVGGAAGLPMELEEEAVRRLEAERDELKEKYLRLAAEYDNFRKRSARERAELADRAQAGLAIKLLDVLDDLDRVVAGDGAPPPNSVMHEAILLIDKKLRKELEAAGLERLDPAGAPFDPSLHEAVSTVPSPDPARDHTVSATFQAGYRFRGTLIRPARVQVYAEQDRA
ncbi:MAG: nucleotide exchange factor GrpE [Gemmatimonadales bacterium]